MQSSYNKVIKNLNIMYSDDNVTITNVNIKVSPEKEYIEERTDNHSGSDSEDNINIDQIRKSLKTELKNEMEEERQALLQDTLDNAKEEAAKLQKEATKKGYEEGHNKGHEEGRNKGYEEGLRQCNQIKQGALKLIEEAELAVEDYYKKNKLEIINLAGTMAESIVHKTVDTSSVLSLIKPIIEQYESTENIILTCNPDSIAYLEENIKKLEEVNPGARFILLKDTNLEKNGCTIENESQIVDLQIGKQIKSIIEDLKNMEV